MTEDLTVSAACRIATHLRTLHRCYPDGQFPNPEQLDADGWWRA